MDNNAKAAWAQVMDLAQRAELPRDCSDIYGRTSRHECGEYPARWVVTEHSFDGYLPNDDGDGYPRVGGGGAPERSERRELRADWQARWDAAQDDPEKLAAFVAEFRDAVGITAAEQAAMEERKRMATDATLRAATGVACRAVAAAVDLLDIRDRCPTGRRASKTLLTDMADGESALAAVLAVECPTVLSRETQEREATKLREYIAGRKTAIPKARRWEAIVAAGDRASDDDIRALIASDWLWPSEAREWQARLDCRAEDRADKARMAKAAQEREEFGQGVWDALAGLKL